MLPAALTFELYSLRFHFRARGLFYFPPFLTGNTFRGALGSFLQSANLEAYRILFATPDPTSEGLATPPRPFALRCRDLDGRTFSPGEVFTLQLNLFWPDLYLLDPLCAAFAAMSDAGFGTARSRATLLLPPEETHHSLPLKPDCGETQALRIHFETPTELKIRDKLGHPLAFPHLWKLVWQRLDRLRSLYGTGPLGFDQKSLQKEAAQVNMADSAVHFVEVLRRGSRTGQTHSLGGFVGHADYVGNMSSFLPLLQAACFTGVGRHTTWGNGELRLETLP